MWTIILARTTQPQSKAQKTFSPGLTSLCLLLHIIIMFCLHLQVSPSMPRPHSHFREETGSRQRSCYSGGPRLHGPDPQGELRHQPLAFARQGAEMGGENRSRARHAQDDLRRGFEAFWWIAMGMPNGVPTSRPRHVAPDHRSDQVRTFALSIASCMYTVACTICFQDPYGRSGQGSAACLGLVEEGFGAEPGAMHRLAGHRRAPCCTLVHRRARGAPARRSRAFRVRINILSFLHWCAAAFGIHVAAGTGTGWRAIWHRRPT